jgi:hypothetical protein
MSEECSTRESIYKFSQETQKEGDNWELDIDAKITLKSVSKSRV